MIYLAIGFNWPRVFGVCDHFKSYELSLIFGNCCSCDIASHVNPEIKFTSHSSPPIPIYLSEVDNLKGNGVTMLRRISAIWSGLIAAVFYAFGSRILFPDQMSPLVILTTSSIIGALVFYRVLTWRRAD